MRLGALSLVWAVGVRLGALSLVWAVGVGLGCWAVGWSMAGRAGGVLLGGWSMAGRVGRLCLMASPRPKLGAGLDRDYNSPALIMRLFILRIVQSVQPAPDFNISDVFLPFDSILTIFLCFLK